jgi:hypothetical protein
LGIEADQKKEQDFFELAERFRASQDTVETKRLGDELGRIVFGGHCTTEEGKYPKTFLNSGQRVAGEKL